MDESEKNGSDQPWDLKSQIEKKYSMGAEVILNFVVYLK